MDDHWKKVTRSLPALVKTVHPTVMLPYLFCLTDSDKEHIRCQEANHGPIIATQQLCDRLKKRKDGYNEFIAALCKEDIGLKHIAEKVDPFHPFVLESIGRENTTRIENPQRDQAAHSTTGSPTGDTYNITQSNVVFGQGSQLVAERHGEGADPRRTSSLESSFVSIHRENHDKSPSSYAAYGGASNEPNIRTLGPSSTEEIPNTSGRMRERQQAQTYSHACRNTKPDFFLSARLPDVPVNENPKDLGLATGYSMRTPGNDVLTGTRQLDRSSYVYTRPNAVYPAEAPPMYTPEPVQGHQSLDINFEHFFRPSGQVLPTVFDTLFASQDGPNNSSSPSSRQADVHGYNASREMDSDTDTFPKEIDSSGRLLQEHTLVASPVEDEGNTVHHLSKLRKENGVHLKHLDHSTSRNTVPKQVDSSHPLMRRPTIAVSPVEDETNTVHPLTQIRKENGAHFKNLQQSKRSGPSVSSTSKEKTLADTDTYLKDNINREILTQTSQPESALPDSLRQGNSFSPPQPAVQLPSLSMPLTINDGPPVDVVFRREEEAKALAEEYASCNHSHGHSTECSSNLHSNSSHKPSGHTGESENSSKSVELSLSLVELGNLSGQDSPKDYADSEYSSGSVELSPSLVELGNLSGQDSPKDYADSEYSSGSVELSPSLVELGNLIEQDSAKDNANSEYSLGSVELSPSLVNEVITLNINSESNVREPSVALRENGYNTSTLATGELNPDENYQGTSQPADNVTGSQKPVQEQNGLVDSYLFPVGIAFGALCIAGSIVLKKLF